MSPDDILVFRPENLPVPFQKSEYTAAGVIAIVIIVVIVIHRCSSLL
jgi:hypothetical protein